MVKTRKSEAKLKVFTKTSLKEIQFMEWHFLPQPEELVRERVLRQFTLKESELEILEGRLEDLLTVTKNRNPRHYLMIQNAFNAKG